MQVSKQKKLDQMGSYHEYDAVFLLKDLSDVMEEQSTSYREKAIQSGRHYSEMLPIEYEPSEEYVQLFHESLQLYKGKLALAVAVVAEQIIEKRGESVVLCSLARAGSPIGVLIKRFIKWKYAIDVPHYSISIIRGRGMDENAIRYITEQHPHDGIQFIDGWTGKGAITKELTKACESYFHKYEVKLDPDLAVLADPGFCSPIYGTREDFLIPSACLNSTVSGLVSRTVLNDKHIKQGDFHGAKFYKNLESHDLSNYYVNEISEQFSVISNQISHEFNEMKRYFSEPDWRGLEEIKAIQNAFKIDDVNLIKPGVGETTRVLLRRIPWKILVKDMNDPRLKHVMLLANEKNVTIQEYKDMSYTCCGLIKPLKAGK